MPLTAPLESKRLRIKSPKPARGFPSQWMSMLRSNVCRGICVDFPKLSVKILTAWSKTTTGCLDFSSNPLYAGGVKVTPASKNVARG